MRLFSLHKKDKPYIQTLGLSGLAPVPDTKAPVVDDAREGAERAGNLAASPETPLQRFALRVVNDDPSFLVGARISQGLDLLDHVADASASKRTSMGQQAFLASRELAALVVG